MKKLSIIIMFILCPYFALAQNMNDLGNPRSLTDADTDASVIMEYVHYLIHKESMYSAQFDTLLNSGDSLFLAVTSPDTTVWSHMYFTLAGEYVTSARIYENPTGATAGASLLLYNRNRNSSNSPSVTIKKDYIATDYGTLISRKKWGSRKSFGGELQGINEWILKQNTVYLYVIISETASNLVSIKLNAFEYEHLD